MINSKDLWLKLYTLMHEGVDKKSRLAHKDLNNKLHYISKDMFFAKDRGIILTEVNEVFKYTPLDTQYGTMELVCDNLKLNCYSCCENHRIHTDGDSLICPNNQCNCLISNLKISEDTILTDDITSNVYAAINNIKYNKLLNTIIIDIIDIDIIKSNNL